SSVALIAQLLRIWLTKALLPLSCGTRFWTNFSREQSQNQNRVQDFVPDELFNIALAFSPPRWSRAGTDQPISELGVGCLTCSCTPNEWSDGFRSRMQLLGACCIAVLLYCWVLLGTE